MKISRSYYSRRPGVLINPAFPCDENQVFFMKKPSELLSGNTPIYPYLLSWIYLKYNRMENCNVKQQW